MEKWPLTVGDGEGLASSIASDGSFLYIHGKFGLLKLGTGYGNTTKVMIECVLHVLIYWLHTLESCLWSCEGFPHQ